MFPNNSNQQVAIIPCCQKLHEALQSNKIQFSVADHKLRLANGSFVETCPFCGHVDSQINQNDRNNQSFKKNTLKSKLFGKKPVW